MSSGTRHSRTDFHHSRFSVAHRKYGARISRKAVNDLLARSMPFCRHRLGAPINGYNSRMPSEPKERRRSEQRNAASRNLDRMSTMQVVRLMNREDRKVAAAV